MHCLQFHARLLLCSLGTTCAAAGEPAFVQPRAVLINHNPIIESRQNRRLHSVAGWTDPRALTAGYLADFESSSHGLLRHRLTQTIDADVYPVKLDGFRYTDASYLAALAGGGWHMPDAVDYKAIVRDYDLARKVDLGVLDEVLVHGAPYFGYYESRMAGRGGYWCNSPPLPRVACSRIFVMMGFNYERGVGEMLHSAGHRCESILTRTYGSWDITRARHDWERFTHNIGQSPDAACGSVHYPPNGTADYDYANVNFVDSTAEDWLNNFPNLTGQTTSINREAWGGPDYHRNYLNWWYAHMPHVGGTNSHDGLTRLNSWWPYLFDFNRHLESGGDHVPGGTPPPATHYARRVHALSGNAGDDWLPRINDAGRVVWSGFDGQDFEIYSANFDGSDLVQITNNLTDDESPQINAAGRVVWQAFDGQDYEICTANADGSDLVRVTNNATDDWHPQINAAGRIVWDGFDGQDYEVFSANADGSDVVQITNNAAGPGQYPREDVWPQINAAGRVAWFGYDGSDWEVYSADADGSGLVNVSNNTLEDEYPQINDSGTVVWHAFHGDTNAEIYAAPATGGVPRRLSNTSFEDWYPQINNAGRVVWMQRRAGDWEIVTGNADGTEIRLLTSNATHDQYPGIDDAGRIVWQGFDGTDWEIYTWIDDVIYQITDNDYDDRAPALNRRGQTVWHADSGPGPGYPTSEVQAVGSNIPGDLDGDGAVGLSDLGIVLTDFGCTGGTPTLPCPGDADGNGTTDLSDLGLVLANFGREYP